MQPTIITKLFLVRLRASIELAKDLKPKAIWVVSREKQARDLGDGVEVLPWKRGVGEIVPEGRRIELPTNKQATSSLEFRLEGAKGRLHGAPWHPPKSP
jgi:hypothetical protein